MVWNWFAKKKWGCRDANCTMSPKNILERQKKVSKT